ncbi:MAG: hypothetical protein HQ568_01065 [Calditrichaeota bacterium]|nr:hypothetical protein [Calditrichota bacterium]
MKPKDRLESDDMRSEYDLDYSKAIRGKYYERLIKEGSNVIVLEPDIARVFQDSASVNEALRSLLEVSKITQRLTTKQNKGSSKPGFTGS